MTQNNAPDEVWFMQEDPDDDTPSAVGVWQVSPMTIAGKIRYIRAARHDTIRRILEERIRNQRHQLRPTQAMLRSYNEHMETQRAKNAEQSVEIERLRAENSVLKGRLQRAESRADNAEQMTSVALATSRAKGENDGN